MCARRPPGGAHGPVPENLLDAGPRLPLNQIKWVLFTVPTELTKIARVSPMPVTILGRRAGSGGIWLPGQKLPVSPPRAEASPLCPLGSLAGTGCPRTQPPGAPGAPAEQRGQGPVSARLGD